jgi:phosphoenolpyruvate synthase/pyruvate phosphate dikinase
MELIRNFKQLNKEDAHLAGGKGASLGEMTQAGIPVPPGFVVLSASFEQFIKETDLVQEIDAILHKVKHNEIHTVEAASEKIRELILNAEMPADIAEEIKRSFKELDTKYVAVRSSATAEDGMDHAWAGQLESYLNTQEDDVLTKVKLCWSSLFTPRAIFYRFEKGLHSTKISVAVVVQKMVESEVSGIAFSVHPVTEDYNQLIIEAGFGLGEAIVSGSVTPDSYVVEKDPRNILDVNISTQERALYRSENPSTEHGNNEWRDIPEPKASSQVLTEKQILELSEIIIQIENHYNFPCDIEWAFEAGKFYIVQSRPITTLSKKTDNQVMRKDYPVYFENTKLNWVKFMERKRTPFIYFPFIEIESQIMPKICGFRFYHHLYKWTGDTGVHFRVADEFVKCDNHFLDLINKKDPRIKEWAKKGKEAEKTADKWLDIFSKKPIPFSIEKFEEFYKDFIDVLLYTATMPYLTLSTIDTELTKGDTREKFEDVLSIYEPLRNTSKYPELERKVLNTWFGEIAEKHNIDPILVHFMKPEEIRDIDSKGIDKEMLRKRKEWSVFWNDIETNNVTFSFEKNIEKSIPVLVEQIDSTDVLKGNTAFPGNARGIVRIINVLEDITEFNQGDILVSLNTNPDLVPAIKKAGAIVTDEGGIMCHAAIVSREFKIPCVIGTKVATKVLKNGDLVEVDADKGIVKIINE